MGRATYLMISVALRLWWHCHLFTIPGITLQTGPVWPSTHWRLWEWLTVTAWRLLPHSTFWCYRNQRGIGGPGRPTEARSGKRTLLRAEQDSIRLWKLKWQQRSLHFPIHPSASVLPVPMNGEIKDGKCYSQGTVYVYWKNHKKETARVRIINRFSSLCIMLRQK